MPADTPPLQSLGAGDTADRVARRDDQRQEPGIAPELPLQDLLAVFPIKLGGEPVAKMRDARVGNLSIADKVRIERHSVRGDVAPQAVEHARRRVALVIGREFVRQSVQLSHRQQRAVFEQHDIRRDMAEIRQIRRRGIALVASGITKHRRLCLAIWSV
jgi:hypothetical protein